VAYTSPDSLRNEVISTFEPLSAAAATATDSVAAVFRVAASVTVLAAGSAWPGAADAVG
jgi:hypothetical protein